MRARRGVSWLVLLASAGCAEPVTEIVLCYRADDAYVVARTELFVTARPLSSSGAPLYDTSIGSATAEGETQGFLALSEDGVDVELRTAPLPSGNVVVQRARIPFQDERIVAIALRVEPACDGVPCASDTTCVGGTCVAADIPPDCLPDHGAPGLPACDARSSGCP